MWGVDRGKTGVLNIFNILFSDSNLSFQGVGAKICVCKDKQILIGNHFLCLSVMP